MNYSSFENSAQLDRGTWVFSERCKPCHGDVGQGLALWRLQWAPEHQNCMFTKCHGLGHPPDGFYMPRDAPPLIGKDAVAHFTNARHWKTAQEIFAYSRERMPLDVPGELSDSDYWAAIAFILRENGKLPLNVQLNATTGAVFMLDPFATFTQIAANAVGAILESPALWIFGFVVIVLAGIGLKVRRQ